MDKREIAHQIKQITKDSVDLEWIKLKNLSLEDLTTLNGRNRLGCDFIDYYFFDARLDTIVNKGITFFDFLDNIEEYKSKKYIQTLLDFCQKNNRYKNNLIQKYYYCYGLCFGRINAFKITNSLALYHKYTPTTIMDPFCGFGGRLVAALLLNINYYGVDLNKDLKPGYDKLLAEFANPTMTASELIDIKFQDALSMDYTSKKYDMVFTSPPYENIEVYKHGEKKSTIEWTLFYNTIFRKLWDNLSVSPITNKGVFAININDKIYNKILVPLFGHCGEVIPLKKSTKNKSYSENIYVWIKNG
jgi:DNA modification methylase